MDKEGLAYEMDEGGGAFYGPKIDLKVKDAIGREWQLTTIQFDFNEPERFDMTYVDADGQQQASLHGAPRPSRVHRALLRRLPRAHRGGFPHLALARNRPWSCPWRPPSTTMPKKAALELKAAGLRVRADLSDDRMNAKIRNAQNAKVPYILVVGAKEEEDGAVAVRLRDGTQLGALKVSDFVSRALEKISAKALDL